MRSCASYYKDIYPLTIIQPGGGGGRGGTSYNGLYGEAPLERGTLSGFRYIKG